MNTSEKIYCPCCNKYNIEINISNVIRKMDTIKCCNLFIDLFYSYTPNIDFKIYIREYYKDKLFKTYKFDSTKDQFYIDGNEYKLNINLGINDTVSYLYKFYKNIEFM